MIMKINIAKKRGYTLIEIMIVIAIVAILVALALPGYGHFVRKARRADAQTDILHFVGVAQRDFTEENSYVNSKSLKPTDGDFYVFSFPDGDPTQSAYKIQAAPKSGTSQVDDACGTMMITETGLKTKTGSDSHCW
jgi:type IV pilus assembly protein PilE